MTCLEDVDCANSLTVPLLLRPRLVGRKRGRFRRGRWGRCRGRRSVVRRPIGDDTSPARLSRTYFLHEIASCLHLFTPFLDFDISDI